MTTNEIDAPAGAIQLDPDGLHHHAARGAGVPGVQGMLCCPCGAHIRLRHVLMMFELGVGRRVRPSLSVFNILHVMLKASSVRAAQLSTLLHELSVDTALISWQSSAQWINRVPPFCPNQPERLVMLRPSHKPTGA